MRLKGEGECGMDQGEFKPQRLRQENHDPLNALASTGVEPGSFGKCRRGRRSCKSFSLEKSDPSYQTVRWSLPRDYLFMIFFE